MPATDPGARKWQSFRFKLNVAGVVILLAFVVGWLNAYRTTSRLAEGAARVERNWQVVDALLLASRLLQEVDIAHRRYLLKAGDEYVPDYRVKVAAFRNEIGTLRQLLSSRADQMARLDSLDTLVVDHLAYLDLSAETARTRGLDAARGQSAESPVDGRYEAMGRLLVDLEQDEMRLASARVAETSSRVRVATAVLMTYGLFDALFIVGAFVIFNRAITRKQLFQQALQQAVKAADAASEAKTRFLATVSHEIRTPLNAVSGMSELLLETRLDQEQREFAEAMRSNAEALSMLIGDLLDSSRIEANQVFLDSAPFDLRELVEGVADILVVRAEVKGVALIVDMSPDIPRQLMGDRNRLRQVLMNLVGNAVKFTGHGQVLVRVRSATSFVGELAMLRIAVIDTGIGIAPEAQAAVFERFVQASRSTVSSYGGTGLGLNIARSLMELMGGKISLRSELGRGSTFEIEVALPIAPTQPPSEFDHTSLAGVEVLVVEPNDSMRETIVRLLQYAGASVRAVATAAAADGDADPAEGARVIVVGERLPESTGLEFARQLWHGSAGAATPGASVVLLCSLRAAAATYVGSYGITACVYLPLKQSRLIQAVRRAAGLETERQEPAGADAQPPALKHHRILLVDDNPDNTTLATRVLVSGGYEVDWAGDGVKAVESAAAFRYDLILMDIELPLIDGMEATRRIRAAEQEAAHSPVPIVGLTAHAVESVREAALSAGMDDYATKPIPKAQLLAICARWVDPRPVLLIADDSPDIHVLLTNYLSRDYRLVFAFNGREAVKAFERQRFSLVMLDVGLPLMNGYEAARAIRRAPGGDVVPIVAVTGYDGHEDRQESLAAGCNAHVSKPVKRADLLALVTRLLGEPAPAHRERASGSELPATGSGAPPAATGTGAVLPSARDTADQARRLLALRDFDGLVALAEELRTTAVRLELSKLATVTEELANAARFEDEQRAAKWEGELSESLGAAQRILDVRETSRTTLGGSYDSLARVATALLGVPLAAVTLSDGDRVQIHGGAGLPSFEDGGLLLSPSFTQLVIDQKGPVLVEDARGDSSLREIAAVRTFGVVSFAGVPLTDSTGVTLGAFGVMDRRPHRWPQAEVAMLEELANVAVRLFEIEQRAEQAATQPATSPEPTAAAPASTQSAQPPIFITPDDDIADLVPDYVAARRADVLTVRVLVTADDYSGIGSLGHKMAGSGAGYGLPEVSRIGKVLEQAAIRHDAESVRQLIDQLGDYLSRVAIRSADTRTPMEE